LCLPFERVAGGCWDWKEVGEYSPEKYQSLHSDEGSLNREELEK
jgi:hypothetical protein